MFNSNPGGERAGETRLQRGLAVVGGIAASFFGTPLAFDATKGAISAFTSQHYGYEWSDWTVAAWFLLLAVGCFFGARVGISDLIQIGRARLGGHFF